MRVFVYRNLRSNCWSVMSLEKPQYGKVIAHVDECMILDAVFRVRESGRQRVLRDKVKNVHAGVVGQFQLSTCALSPVCKRRVSYNPYKAPTFLSDGKPVFSAPACMLAQDGKAYLCQTVDGLADKTG